MAKDVFSKEVGDLKSDFVTFVRQEGILVHQYISVYSSKFIGEKYW